ncbi:MAG TPA: SDR family NAD(P)-dependent oxidoreductase [Acidimicrobiales bacterium]|nr:SDR family NAD(P)-dependent oxidoreductase [Acidimicrobiales bacterium]
MSDHGGKVAVVTGAASGIGFAIAERAGAEGMTVVLADLDTERLASARDALTAKGMEAHAMEVDVSERSSVMHLAERVQEEVGPTWLLVNNAGVFVAAPFMQSTVAQWEFILGVNLWGVVHGMHAFLPGMVERNAGHVVNTSSVDGLVTVQNTSSYVASKHAVVALTETLHRELQDAGSDVGVSVLCPGAIVTDILRSARHWPARLGPAPAVPDGEYPRLDEMMQPEEVATKVFDSLEARRFWILTHPEQYAPAMRARTEEAIAGTNPGDDSVDPNFRRSTGRRPGS